MMKRMEFAGDNNKPDFKYEIFHPLYIFRLQDEK